MRQEMTTLGESCQFFNGKAHEKDIDAEGQFVVVNSKFISTDGEVKKFTAKQMFPLVVNDIVMVMSDVPNGKALAKCYMIEENDKYSLNQRICSIRTTEFNIRFLYYQLNRHPYLLAFNNGENQTNLRKGDILNCPLWKPTLDVQAQIVKLLDEALDQIEQAQGNIEQNILNTKELFQSKLNEIFSQKGDGWEEKTLGEVCEMIKRGVAPKYIDSGGLTVINQKCIRDHKINLELSRRHDLALKNVNPERLIRLGDVLVNSTGTGTLGRVAQVRDKSHIGCTVDTHVTIVRPIEGMFYNDFFGYALIRIEKEITEGGEGTSGQTELARTKLENEFQICFPLDQEIQKRYVVLLDDLNVKRSHLIIRYQVKLSDLESLKKSILQKAFSGELTKQQEPITI